MLGDRDEAGVGHAPLALVGRPPHQQQEEQLRQRDATHQVAGQVVAADPHGVGGRLGDRRLGLGQCPPSRRAELGGVRGLLLDLTPLRGREFRLLFVGQMISFFGSMITFVALPFQLYEETGSTLAVGALGVCEFVPILTVALVSGALADAFDRRLLVLVSELGSAAVMAVLLANTLLADPQVWVLFVCSALLAGFYALLRPPLDALVPRVVPREQIKAAMALEWLRGDVGMVAGPAVGGVLIAAFGLTTTYAIDLATFLISLGFLAAMRASPPAAGADAPSLRSIVEGLRYARSRPELMGTYLVDINAMFFGIPEALFPALAVGYGGPEVLGLLLAAPAAGSLLVALFSGWTGTCTATAARSRWRRAGGASRSSSSASPTRCGSRCCRWRWRAGWTRSRPCFAA